MRDAHALVYPETHHGFRYGDTRAEALRLRQRVAGQLCAGDAGRETKIVLDPRARACLPTGRKALEDDDVQSFGGSIHRGSEPRGTCTDDGQIVHLCRIESDVEPRTVRELFDRRASQKAPFAADDDGRIRGRNAELPKELLGLSVAFQVDPRERDRIPCGEVAKAMRIDGKPSANSTSPARTARR